MIFTIARKTLVKHANACAAVANGDKSIAICDNIRIEADQGVVFTGTDTYTTVIARASGNVESPGSCIVDAKSLREVAASLPATISDVEIERKDSKLHLRAGKAKRVIACLDANDYPTPAREPRSMVGVTGPALLRAIAMVNHAMSTDDSRPNMAGIHVACGSGRVVARATDGHRIAHTEIECDAGTFDALLPGAGIKAVRAALADAGACDVEIGSEGGHVTIRCGEVTTILRLTDSPFAPTERAFALEFPHVATANRDMLLTAIKGARVTAKQGERERADAMAFTFRDGEIAICSRGVKGESSDVVDCNYAGPEMSIGFQPDYLLDILNAMPDDDIQIAFASDIAPARIMPATHERSKFVVLPQRL